MGWWNLPDGCNGADPRAPWNQGDPWEGRECGECRHCKEVAGAGVLACDFDPGALCAVSETEDACEGFEERRVWEWRE